MGRYKDYHREPKRGGLNDGGPTTVHPEVSQALRDERVTGARTEAIVKWFNTEKGSDLSRVGGPNLRTFAG